MSDPYDDGGDGRHIPLAALGANEPTFLAGTVSGEFTQYTVAELTTAVGGGGGGSSQKFPVYSTNFESIAIEQDPEGQVGRYVNSSLTGPTPTVSYRGVRVPSGTDPGEPGYLIMIGSNTIAEAIRAGDYDIVFTGRIDGYDGGDDSTGFIGFGNGPSAVTCGVQFGATGVVTLVSGAATVVAAGVDADAFHTYRVQKTAAGSELFVDGVSAAVSATVPTSAGVALQIVSAYGTVGEGLGGPQIAYVALYAPV